MTETATITPNFQVHIPLKIRQAVGLTKPMKTKITAVGKKIVLEPIENDPVLELAGIFSDYEKNAKGVDIDNVRDVIDYSNW